MRHISPNIELGIVFTFTVFWCYLSHVELPSSFRVTMGSLLSFTSNNRKKLHEFITFCQHLLFTETVCPLWASVVLNVRAHCRHSDLRIGNSWTCSTLGVTNGRSYGPLVVRCFLPGGWKRWVIIAFWSKINIWNVDWAGQQHSFPHERMFLWKCQSFWDRKCFDSGGL